MEQQYKGPVTDRRIRELFADAGDFNYRTVEICGFPVHTYAIDGLTSGGDISEYVFRPISENLSGNLEEAYDAALHGAVYNSAVSVCEDVDEVALKLVNGFCIVLFPGVGALAFEVKTGVKRGPSSPEVENTVKGPKDAFVETIRVNTSLIRRHLRTPDLRLYETKVGCRSLTNVTVAWVEGITNPELVKRMKRRLDTIDIDGFLSPSAVEEYVTGSRATAFPLLQYTERPDRFCQGLLEGRVGVMADGLPFAWMLPGTIDQFFKTGQDRAFHWMTASALNLIRWFCAVITVLVPGLYIALVTFHPEAIPVKLALSIAAAKQEVPFSTVFEVLIMLLAFEVLQEAGLRLPSPIGATVSILGRLVVGNAAVEAHIVSPAVLIAVAIAGVAGYTMPSQDFASALRLWRFLLAIAVSIGGLFGLAAGCAALIYHLAGLETFGVPYLAPFTNGAGQPRGHPSLLRLPLPRMKWRDGAKNTKNRRNQR